MLKVWWQFRRAVQEAEMLDIGRLVAAGCVHPMTEQVRAAYDAPFPEERAKAGARAMPGLVPTRPDDPASEANRAAWQVLSASTLAFLVAFSDSDPITGAMAPVLRKLLPGTRGLRLAIGVNSDVTWSRILTSPKAGRRLVSADMGVSLALCHSPLSGDRALKHCRGPLSPRGRSWDLPR